jgi:hypothetical protein
MKKPKQRTVILPPSLTRKKGQGIPKIKEAESKEVDPFEAWERPKINLSPMWNDAKPADIGAGFRPASQANKQALLKRSATLKAQKEMEDLQTMSKADRIQAQAERTINSKFKHNKHPFLNGNNQFIFYLIKVDVKKMAEDAKAKRKLIKRVNYANPIPKQQKSKFVGRLKSNIESTADFLWTEVLPITNSMLSAIERVDDFSQQTLEEPSGIPAEYLRRKMMDAVHLRIIRHVADTFKLTADERILFTSEFRNKMLAEM